MLNLTTMQGARRGLQTSLRTIYRMVAEGALPEPHHLRNHRQSYFQAAEFEAAVNKELGLRAPKSSSGNACSAAPTIIAGTGGMLNLITVQQASEILQTSRRTIYRMVAEGALPALRHVRGHRKSYFLKNEFEAAVNKELGLRVPKSSAIRENSAETGCATTSSKRRRWAPRATQTKKGRPEGLPQITPPSITLQFRCAPAEQQWPAASPPPRC